MKKAFYCWYLCVRAIDVFRHRYFTLVSFDGYMVDLLTSNRCSIPMEGGHIPTWEAGQTSEPFWKWWQWKYFCPYKESVSNCLLCSWVILLLIPCSHLQDIPGCATIEELTEQFALYKLCWGRSWHIQACDAQSGTGLHDGLDWLSRQLVAAGVYDIL